MRPPRFLRWFHAVPGWGRGLLPAAAFAATLPAWAASGITLTIDCAYCGPGQEFPHDCPRLAGASAAAAATSALPGLVEQARREHRRLAGISGLHPPDLGPMDTPAQLDTTLAALITAVEAEIDRCERERQEYAGKGASAEAERTRLAQLVAQTTAQLEEMRREIADTERENTALIRAATAARDETRTVQKSTAEIRAEIRQVRNRLFPRLQLAANRGWIPPPSSYRPVPVPLPLKTQRLANHTAADVDAASPARTQDSGGLRMVRVPTAAAPRFSESARNDVQAKLDRLRTLGERFKTAFARRAEAIRTLDIHRQEKDAESARLSTLEPTRAALASQRAVVRRNAPVAKRAAEEFGARLAEARTTAVLAWLEWGIFQWIDRKSEALLAARGPAEPASVGEWDFTAALATELGSDPLAVITRFPATLAARGETLGSVQRDLTGTREKFGLGFVATGAELPPAALPYLKEGPP